MGWGQPIVALFTTNICPTGIFLIFVCFIFILITLLCYLVFFLMGKLVYHSFFPVFQGNTPLYSQFSIGGAYDRVWSILVYNLCLIACGYYSFIGYFYITTGEPFCIDNVSFCLWWQGWYSCFLGSREKIFSLPLSVCGGSEKSLWRFEVIVGLGYTC